MAVRTGELRRRSSPAYPMHRINPPRQNIIRLVREFVGNYYYIVSRDQCHISDDKFPSLNSLIDSDGLSIFLSPLPEDLYPPLQSLIIAFLERIQPLLRDTDFTSTIVKEQIDADVATFSLDQVQTLITHEHHTYERTATGLAEHYIKMHSTLDSPNDKISQLIAELQREVLAAPNNNHSSLLSDDDDRPTTVAAGVGGPDTDNPVPKRATDAERKHYSPALAPVSPTDFCAYGALTTLAAVQASLAFTAYGVYAADWVWKDAPRALYTLILASGAAPGAALSTVSNSMAWYATLSWVGRTLTALTDAVKNRENPWDRSIVLTALATMAVLTVTGFSVPAAAQAAYVAMNKVIFWAYAGASSALGTNSYWGVVKAAAYYQFFKTLLKDRRFSANAGDETNPRDDLQTLFAHIKADLPNIAQRCPQKYIDYLKVYSALELEFKKPANESGIASLDELITLQILLTTRFYFDHCAGANPELTHKRMHLVMLGLSVFSAGCGLFSCIPNLTTGDEAKDGFLKASFLADATENIPADVFGGASGAANAPISGPAGFVLPQRVWDVITSVMACYGCCGYGQRPAVDEEMDASGSEGESLLGNQAESAGPQPTRFSKFDAATFAVSVIGGGLFSIAKSGLAYKNPMKHFSPPLEAGLMLPASLGLSVFGVKAFMDRAKEAHTYFKHNDLFARINNPRNRDKDTGDFELDYENLTADEFEALIQTHTKYGIDCLVDYVATAERHDLDYLQGHIKGDVDGKGNYTTVEPEYAAFNRKTWERFRPAWMAGNAPPPAATPASTTQSSDTMSPPHSVDGRLDSLPSSPATSTVTSVTSTPRGGGGGGGQYGSGATTIRLGGDASGGLKRSNSAPSVVGDKKGRQRRRRRRPRRELGTEFDGAVQPLQRPRSTVPPGTGNETSFRSLALDSPILQGGSGALTTTATSTTATTSASTRTSSPPY